MSDFSNKDYGDAITKTHTICPKCGNPIVKRGFMKPIKHVCKKRIDLSLFTPEQKGEK